jgi:hypothetical protein
MDVHEMCLNELVRKTQGLGLGFPASEIRKRRLEHRIESDGSRTIHNWERGITFFPLQEQESPGTNAREDIGYGCGCLIVLPADHGSAENLGKVLEARAKIRRAFIHQRMENVSLSGGMYLTTKVAHLPINQPRGPHSYEASSLLIRCWMREPRG